MELGTVTSDLELIKEQDEGYERTKCERENRIDSDLLARLRLPITGPARITLTSFSN